MARSSPVLKVIPALMLAGLSATCSSPEGVPERLSPGSTRIAVIGDYGAATSAEQAVAEMVTSWAPDFIITTGDNSYSTDIDVNIGQYYHAYIHPYAGAFGPGAMTNRFFPSLGNHDWDFVIRCSSDSCAGAYLDYFTLPGNERYYAVRLGPVHVFVIDSDNHEPDGTLVSSAQAEWLRAGLSESGAPWNLVCFHHPPFASSSAFSLEMRWPFSEWGASAVLSGHLHVYERIVKAGFPYFINGLGGRSRQPFGKTPDPDSQVRYNANFGAMLVEADDWTIRYQFFSITDGGTLIDTHTTRKRIVPAT